MRQRGFTYILLLWWVAISGVLLAALGQQWLMESRRQKEQELVFRGRQMGLALRAYRDATPEGQVSAPASLSELLEDKRGPKPRRHLRQLWPDPITGKPWVLERQGDRILAVHSSSKAMPIKPPEGVESYQQWWFDANVWVPTTPAPPAASAASSGGHQAVSVNKPS
jgi:type II secretory pathway pseudopilin PulG